MRRIGKIAGFIAGVLILIMILNIPFRGGYWFTKGYLAERDSRIAGIQEEPEGQIDVLVVGDSLANNSVSPLELYRDHGITSYIMGRDLQRCIETYYAIRLALKSQDIKVVLWEAHNLCKHQKAPDRYIVRVSEFARYMSQFIKYHYVWSRLFEKKTIRRYFKGYEINEAVTPFELNRVYPDREEKEAFYMPEDQVAIFKMVYALCQREGIKLVLYCAPSPHCYSTKMHNGYKALAQEYGLDYLSCNWDIDKIGIDYSTDYFDEDANHLNLSGIRKTTAYLAQYLVNECSLTDHRGDPAYRSWDELLPEYDREVEEMAGTSYPEIEKALKKKNKE